MASRGRKDRRSRGFADVNYCCYWNRERRVQEMFLCDQHADVSYGGGKGSREDGNVTVTGQPPPVVGGAYCCQPARDTAFCCSLDEFQRGRQKGFYRQPRCRHPLGGRRFFRRTMVPRAALIVGSLLLLVIIGIVIYFCLKKKLLRKKRGGRVHGWLITNGMLRQQSDQPPAAPIATGQLITPYQQATGVYSLPASNHPVQYIGGSQCPLREYGPLQPAYPERQFNSAPPPAMPRLTEIG